MLDIKQTVLRRLGIKDASWLPRYQFLKRKVLGTDNKLRAQYLASASCAKLHLGSSNHMLDGWLNTDLSASPGVMALDATAPYPFADATFDYVFSEHMIEHVPYDSALRMLKECHRVLKPGGVIRVVTPDLAKILNVYSQPEEKQCAKYLQWMSATFTPGVSENHAAYVVNAFFRLWGHQFIYDEPTLSNALRKCNFKQPVRQNLGESGYAELRNLEHIERYPEGLLNYESICLEATK